jgi:hypothetical protein
VQIPCPETTPFFFCLGVHVASFAPPQSDNAIMAEAQREAHSGLADMLNGTEQAPAEAPAVDAAPTDSAQPAAPPQAPGQPAPPAAPVSDAPAVPTTIDLSTLTPEARAFFERKGFDANKAFADALRNDSRLAALARGEADPLGQVKLGAQPPQPTQPEPPAAPVAVDPQAIEQRVAQFYQSDPTCVQAVQAFKANQARIDEITTTLDSLTPDLQRARLLASLEEVKADPLRSQDLRQQIAEKETERLRLEQEKDLLLSRNEREDTRFQNAVQAKRAELFGEHQRQLQEQQEREAYEARVETVASELERAWQPALLKAMEDAKIPADEQADFNEEAMLAVYAELEKTGMTVQDLPGFLAKRAEKYFARMDRNHRRQSAVYAKQAHAVPALGTSQGVVAAAPTQETAEPTDLNDLYKQTRRDLLSEARGR